MTKTSLEFVGPADLSVGQIRITGSEGVVRDWMATPSARSLHAEDIVPGFYRAEITPAGVPPQSVVFEVRAGQANTISVPSFAALAADGGGTNFLGMSDETMTLQAESVSLSDLVSGSLAGLVHFTADFTAETAAPAGGAAAPNDERLLTVALAMERQGKRESWDRFTGSYNARQQGANLSLDIQPPEDWDPASGRRARLSLAIQDLRIERLLLPLYRGGTAINITPSVLSGSDVSVEVVPLDPNIRAIWRALEAGTREHAAAVRDHVFRVKGPLPIEALAAADPWEAMLAGLLFLRFPEEFGELSPEWTRILCERHQWAADAFVIRARQIASAAARSPETIGESARQAVRLLTAAQACGSPYFSITNLYFNELVEGLSSVPGLSGEVTDALTRARRRWQRELPLQRSAGITFSWLSRDQNLLKKKRILAPKQDVSGRLSGRNTTIVFKGQIRAGAIAFEAPSSVAPKRTDAPVGSAKMGAVPNGSSSFHPSAPDDCPALSRPPGPDDDPNNGRFGGQTEVIGFRLGAQFPEDNAKAVTIVLSVDAGEHTQVELGDCVWFCLHPTFNPEWVRVLFQGRRASLTVRAWGGFTVGAWLPTQQVELECDLASIDDAPRIIKDR